jgi:hypothetical protein
MATFFVTGRDGAEIFQPVDCTLDDIAALVSGRIESWWGTSSVALTQSILLRIAALRANTAHATVLDLLSIMARAIGAVYAQARRPFARASSARTGHADSIEYGADLRCVAALPGSDHDRQG